MWVPYKQELLLEDLEAHMAVVEPGHIPSIRVELVLQVMLADTAVQVAEDSGALLAQEPPGVPLRAVNQRLRFRD